MTKFFFVFFVIISSANCFAFTKNSYFLTENDTLNKQYFDSLSYKTYASPGGGFVSGNNAYLDLAKVQEFHAGNYCNIFGVIINFGYKKYSSLNDSSYLGINYYHINNTGKTTVSSSAACPGSIFFRDSIKVADIDTVNGNVLIYSNSLFTDSNFAIGIDFDQLRSTDTIALYTNKDGDAANREQSWEQDASGNWFTLKYNWPLNVDYAIFPIVNTSVGLNTISTKSQSIIISPNPCASGMVNINLSYAAINHLKVYNNALQIVNASIVSSDENNTLVKFDAISKGIYFIQIKTKDAMSIQKLIVK
jgi:hypothetical protein